MVCGDGHMPRHCRRCGNACGGSVRSLRALRVPRAGRARAHVRAKVFPVPGRQPSAERVRLPAKMKCSAFDIACPQLCCEQRLRPCGGTFVWPMLGDAGACELERERE